MFILAYSYRDLVFLWYFTINQIAINKTPLKPATQIITFWVEFGGVE